MRERLHDNVLREEGHAKTVGRFPKEIKHVHVYPGFFIRGNIFRLNVLLLSRKMRHSNNIWTNVT